MDQEEKNKIKDIFKYLSKKVNVIKKVSYNLNEIKKNHISFSIEMELEDMNEKTKQPKVSNADLAAMFKEHIIEFKEFKTNINTKIDEHIGEFKNFKTDMLEFKKGMFSLPTIAKELKGKK